MERKYSVHIRHSHKFLFFFLYFHAHTAKKNNKNYHFGHFQDFRDLFYSFTRNIARNINNWRHVDDQYGNGNGFGTYAQPSSSVRFSYNTDYKTVGDYCYTKSLTGVCTNVNKCPEVIRDIQKGKNPVVCSYQGSEAIVCCPKRNSQPSQQQVWSNNNNNQFYQQQGSITNQNPANQIDNFYQTQPPNQQFYQPNQVNQFDQIRRPYLYD